MLRLLDQAPHRFADFTAGTDPELLHRLLDPLDLDLGLFDVELDAFPQGRRARHSQSLLHAAQSLLFSAICVLQLFYEQFANFGFHCVFLI